MAKGTRHTIAVVPAAGRGHRMGGSTAKQFLELGGLPIVVHSLKVLDAAPSVQAIILAVPESEREFCRREIVGRYGIKKVSQVVAGGTRRQDSVRHGISAIDGPVDIVLVHDAVRPFLTVDMIECVIERADELGSALVALPMRDTVKEAGADGRVDGTVDRNRLWLAQTPQAFRAKLLRDAHQQAFVEGKQATDDAQLVEWLGHRVAIVEGSAENIKITRPEDLSIGEAILAARRRRDA